MKMYLRDNMGAVLGDIVAEGRADTFVAAKERAIEDFCKTFQERPETVEQDLMEEYLVWDGPYA